MTVGQRIDIEANEHWVRVANDINRFYAKEHEMLQNSGGTIFHDPAASGAVIEHLMTLSEIVADLAQSMADYHRWRGA